MATNIRVRVHTKLFKKLEELEQDKHYTDSKKVNKWLFELLSIKLGVELEINEKTMEFREIKE